MSVTNIQLLRTAPNSYIATWDSDVVDATFTIFVAGSFFKTTKGKWLAIDIPVGEYPVIEIRDGSETPGIAAATGIILEWAHIAGSVAYHVEQYVGGSWTTIAVLKADGGATYHFNTAGIADATATQFRVSSISSANIAGSLGTVTATISRHPDPPGVALSYDDGTGLLTVAAAA